MFGGTLRDQSDGRGDNTPLANVYVVGELGLVDVVLLYKNIVA